MKRSANAAVVISVSTSVLASVAVAQSLSIHDIQFTTNPTGDSDYNGTVVDCRGGICVGKYGGYRPRLILQDPNYPDGWGGIQTKDWIYPYDMFNDVQIGDWVEMSNMLVEDHRGTTFLQRQSAYNPVYNIVSQGNPLPPWLEVTVDQVPAPLYDLNNPNGAGWYVENHDAEIYESMLLEVRCVTETGNGFGKAVDNYNLKDADENDCWATDYMNEAVGALGLPSAYRRARQAFLCRPWSIRTVHQPGRAMGLLSTGDADLGRCRLVWRSQLRWEH